MFEYVPIWLLLGVPQLIMFLGAAFTTKTGIHASALAKDPTTYEHVAPETAARLRRIAIQK